MNNFLYFYIEANIFCIIISFILVIRELRNIDKQLRNIEFIKTVIIYMFLYLFDIIWCLSELKLFNQRGFITHIIHFLIFSVFSYGSYQWFIYSEVAQGNTEVYNLKNRIKWCIPIYIFVFIFFIYTIVIYAGKSDNVIKIYKNSLHVLMFFIVFFYEVVSCIKSMKRAFYSKKRINRNWYIFMGLNPIIFSSAIVIQFMLKDIPIFCFLNTIAMLCFYFRSLDNIISLDSLTKLNNRNQLNKFFHQLQPENGYKNFVLVIDIDKFKAINDRYGHLEGDNALILVAESFKRICTDYPYRTFLSRYGGDEFVIIVQAVTREDVEGFKSELNKIVAVKSLEAQKPYELNISVGIAEIYAGHEKIENFLEMADKEMYLEKKNKYSVNCG